MKKIIFSLLIIHCSLLINNCVCQLPPHYYWRVVPSPVQNNLNNIILSNSNYYVVGDNGTLLYRLNWGNSFLSASGLPNNNFYGICDLYNIFLYSAVGQNGLIYYCSGSPYSSPWNQQTTGITSDIFSVYGNRTSYSFPIYYARLAVGGNGTILKSTYNLGGSWSPWTIIPSGTTQDLYSIGFYNNPNININLTGYVSGNNGTLLRTTNFGDNWTSINLGITNKLNCVRFIDTLTGWITGSNGLIMKTTNGGFNWNSIPSRTTSDLKYFSTRNSNTDSVYYICGNNGIILQTTNRGITWATTPTPTTNNLNSILYPYVIGNSGTILRRDEDSSYIIASLDGNNIKSEFSAKGIFDQDDRSGNLAGFEWPKGSGKTAIFTAGLSIAGFDQGQLREAMASYSGEFRPGFCNNGIAHTSDTFKFYSVKRGDGPSTNPDWLNWSLMVPYGAPFVDVNYNGIYDPQIDTPGVKGASQTIFLCYTDGFPESHNPGEGFGGGTAPLYSEVHLTAWCYSQPSYNDMQFLKFDVINKSTQPWTRTQFSIISDPDLGSADDDFIGCDTSKNLGYCYNATNYDQQYGTAPPAVGFIFLKGAYNKYSNPPKQFNLTSFGTFYSSMSSPPICEAEPNGEPYPAYNFMQGYKKDSTCWLDPTQLVTPPDYYKKTKFIYPGDPETGIGWTEYTGHVGNCGNDSSGTPITINASGDRRFILNSGAENITVMPGDTQKIVICQLIAKGSSNKNSVTKLKQLADVAIQFYNSGYVIGINKTSSEVPSTFRLEQNYPNPFNPITKIKFDIAPLSRRAGGVLTSLKIYDITGREIQTLVNEKLNPGSYEVTFDGSNFASGVYFYQLRTGDFIETKKLVLLK